MTQEEFELVLEHIAKAIREQYVDPIAVALCVVTSAICHGKDRAWIQRELQRQIATCPPDIAGRAILELLAHQASLPKPPSPAAVRKAVRTSLRLIPGGKKYRGK